jgi:hypothetical protein
MHFANPLKIDCPACGARVLESVEWLLEEGRTCPTCHGSFAGLQDSIRMTIANQNDFTGGVFSVVELENRWAVEIPDEAVARLFSVDAIADFIFDAVVAKGLRPQRWEVLESIYQAARNALGASHLQLDSDVFVALRRQLKSAPVPPVA